MAKAKTQKLSCGRPRALSHSSGDPDKLSRWKEQLRTFLEKNKLKFSEQRWKIAQFILGTEGHFSAQEMVKRITKAHPSIGAATVYRNIKVLCDAHILRETLVNADGTVVYESFDDEHHDHIVCLDCGEIFEFHDETIEKKQEELVKKSRFRQVRHRHVLYAHCDYKKG